MIRPSICKLDEQVKNTQKSQLVLSNHINNFSICKFITNTYLLIFLKF